MNPRIVQEVPVVSSKTLDGVPELWEMLRIKMLAEDKGYFPQYNKLVPMVYERVRWLIEALKAGEDFEGKVYAAWSLRLLGRADASRAVHFLPLDDLVAEWEQVLDRLPDVRAAMQGDAATVVSDALAILEGEGLRLRLRTGQISSMPSGRNFAASASLATRARDPAASAFAPWREVGGGGCSS